jgi:hypothetical protein
MATASAQESEGSMSTTTTRNGEPKSLARPTKDGAAARQPPTAEEYDEAIHRNVVTFEQVVAAAFGRRSVNHDSDDRQVHARYFAPLLRNFADAHVCPRTTRPHNGILRYYFASHIDAAAIMTADDGLYVQFKPTGSNDGDFINLLIRLNGVHIKARHALQGQDYRTIMESVFTGISLCMSSLDLDWSSRPEPADKKVVKRERARILRFLQGECARAEQDLDNIIHRRAERTYFNGMLGAVLALGAAAVALANLLDHSGGFDTTYRYLLTVGLAGGIGATISVMWRITFGRFSPSNAIIAFQRGKRASLTLAILGAVRPFIGVVFGLIVFALDRAGLLPLKSPGNADDLYFYAAIAFFAGFSERWAQSTLKNAIPLSEQTTPGADPQLPPTRAGQKPAQP